MKPQTVVITGASAGLGRAAAREFGRHGATIGLLARGTDGLEAAKREIEDLGGMALAIQQMLPILQPSTELPPWSRSNSDRSTSG